MAVYAGAMPASTGSAASTEQALRTARAASASRKPQRREAFSRRSIRKPSTSSAAPTAVRITSRFRKRSVMVVSPNPHRI